MKTSKKKKYARKPEETFKIPEGTYQARLNEVFVLERGSASKIRFVFQVEADDQPDKKLLAGKSYRINATKMLYRDLNSWLSNDERREALLGADSTTTVELEGLVGTLADIVVTHRFDPNYEDPCCYIRNIRPPGTLVGVGMN